MKWSWTTLWLASCGTVAPATVPPLCCARIETATGVATATSLGNGLWLTAQHVVSKNQIVVLAGHPDRIEVVAVGDGSCPGGDWCFFRSGVLLDPALPYDASGKLPARGEQVTVLGYGGEKGELLMITARFRELRQGSIVLDFPDDRVYYGISGGPVIHNGRLLGVISGRVTEDGDVFQAAARPFAQNP